MIACQITCAASTDRRRRVVRVLCCELSRSIIHKDRCDTAGDLLHSVAVSVVEVLPGSPIEGQLPVFGVIRELTTQSIGCLIARTVIAARK